MSKLHTTVKLIAATTLATLMTVYPAALHADTDDVLAPLYAGTAAQAVQTLQDAVDAEGNDEQRFALGIAQTCAAIERLTASLNRYGLNARMAGYLRMIGMPSVVMDNPAEEPIDAAMFRQMLERFNKDLQQAQQTLQAIEPDADLKVVLDITRVRLDYNGDGQAGPDEALGVLVQRVQQMQQRMFMSQNAEEEPQPEPEPFPIALDAGDLHWLHGYCHVLMGMADIVLAHDTDEIFNRTAHLFFAHTETPYDFLARKDVQRDTMMNDILDFVAFIHLINLEVTEPDRMTDALAHFKQVSAISRQSWQAILAETDNDREWIPAPGQDSVLGPALTVDQDRVDAWMSFLDEFDAILAGDKLIPFWRGEQQGTVGVNLAKVFQDPPSLDLILWLQGSAAKPYLQEGELTDPQFWRQLTRAFRGDFMTFAVIVN